MSEQVNPPQPPSQFEKELELIDKYKGGDLEVSMEFNLNILRRFAGIGIPQFKAVNPKDEYPSDPEFTEDLGDGMGWLLLALLKVRVVLRI